MLLQIQGEAALVIVVPPSLVVGPTSLLVVDDRLRVFPIRAVPVSPDDAEARWQEGRGFLIRIAVHWLALPAPLPTKFVRLLERAATQSGGVPRVFLQILRNAGMYATLAGRALPFEEDFFDAERDQHDTLTRILRDGDYAILRSADGTDGKEVPIDRRLRFLSHGLLLEYGIAERTIVHPAPLIERPEHLSWNPPPP